LVDVDGDGSVSAEDFKALFSTKYTVLKPVSLTKEFAVTAETVCQLESGAEVLCFGEQKEDESGLVRSECKSADGKTGWVSLRQMKGGAFLAAYNGFKSFTSKIENAMQEHFKKVKDIAAFVNAKMKEGGPQKEGPLADARKAMEYKEKAKVAENTMEQLKKNLQKAKTDWQTTERSELNAHIEAKNKAAAEETVAPAKADFEVAEKAAEKVTTEAAKLTALDADAALSFATPAAVVKKVDELLLAAAEKAEAGKKIINEQMKIAKEVKPPTGGSNEAIKQLQAMITKIEAGIRAGKKAQQDCKQATHKIVAKYSSDSKTAIRKAASAKGMGVGEFFDSIAKKKDKIAEADLAKILIGLDGLAITPEHAKLLSSSIQKDGVSKYKFLSFSQLYYKVVKDIAFTDKLDLESAKTLRKAEAGEVVEVLEGPTADEKSGLTRAKVKSMLDAVTGWVTVASNSGSKFLEETQKLYLSAKKLQALEESPAFGSKELRQLHEDEVLEVIGGPEKMTAPDVMRAKVKATKDQVIGWITVKDQTGDLCKSTDEYVIKTPVAMTDGEDVKTSKVVRKLELGEKFISTGESLEDSETGTFRVKGKSNKDGKEGWVTTKGNKGSVYAEVSAKTLTALKEVPLQTMFKSSSPAGKRKFEAGESMTVMEGPKEEKNTPQDRVKVRALSDQKIGWVTKTELLTKRWMPSYRVVLACPLQKPRSPGAAEGTEPIRELIKAETLELLEGPLLEDGVMRIRVSCQKDGATGWVTIKGTDGKRYIE